MSFTWIPLYSEIARKVLEFENRQGELLSMLGQLKLDGVKVIALTDRDASGKEIQLAEIDPFTFFANFNRTSLVAGRQAILAKIKTTWQLAAPVPDDFDGIPTANAQNSWAFASFANRTPNDIPILWRAAREGVEKDWRTFDRKLFDEALNISQMGIAKLSMSLFWLNPRGFLPCDKHTRAYLKGRGIVWDGNTATGYFSWLEKAVATAGNNFPQISLDAYEADTEESEETNENEESATVRGGATTGPRFVRFIGPVLDALRALGGSGTPKAVADWVAEQTGISQDERSEKMASGNSRFQNHIDWSRFYLSKVGLISSETRGVWQLTAAGQSAHPSMSDSLELFQRVHEMAADKENPAESPEVDNLEYEKTPRSYWTFSAGEGGEYWQEFCEKSIVAIGFKGTPDLRQFDTKDDIRNKLIELSPGDPGKKINDGLACWQFVHDIKPGDIIFAKQGLTKLLGCGVVMGDYQFDETRPAFRHVRKVKWLAKGDWELPEDNKMAVKTLTNVTSYPDFIKLISDKVGLNLQTDLVAPTRAYWWLNANPKIWDFRSAAVGSLQTYTSHNEDGNKRQKYKHFTAVRPGDLLVGYVTNPDKEIVAVCEITKALHDTPTGEAIEFKKIESFQEPVTWAELQSVPALSACEPLISNQGSLFALTEEEYETIRTIIDERNVGLQIEKNAPFTKADALKGLFMSEAQLDVILARLKRKKAVILQGPPGVGKTFVARRLAFALMGECDKRRVSMVQFHPSYGYEDFVQGFRPTRLGLERRDGIFYEFARLARNDPDRDWFFIIDEINRGNLAKIFGELLMLLEADKRGPDHAIPLTYSEKDETFNLPAKLHVIGTMNTADRSLAMVDYALRRRFAFVTLDPAFDSVEFSTWLTERGAPASLIARIRHRVAVVNAEIEKERDLGPGFRIGHSFFCPADGQTPDEAWYCEIVKSEIQPLLEEYFDSRERVEKLVSELLA